LINWHINIYDIIIEYLDIGFKIQQWQSEAVN